MSLPPGLDETRPDETRPAGIPSDETPPAETSPRPPALGRRLASPRSLLSLLLAFLLIGFFLRSQDPAALREAWAAIRGAHPGLYLAALGTYYLAFPIRGLRWRLLLRNTGLPPQQLPRVRDLAEIIYLSWFVNSIVPAKLGDLYRGWLLQREGGPAWSAGMGTIVAERMLDFLVLVTLTVITGLATYGEVLTAGLAGGPLACLRGGLHLEQLGCSLLQLFVLAGAMVLALVVGLLAFARWGWRLARRLPPRPAELFQQFSGALLLSFRGFGPILGLSVLAWVAEGAAFLLVGLALGLRLPLPLVVFFSLLQAFITVIPLTPGAVGLEFILVSALTIKGYDGGPALAMTGLYRTISFLSLIVGGAAVYLFSRKTRA
ncbi:MAG: flippase-like domain-containing protein [Ardenticatenia bacterium]|nr:flippase-like domain-containing protein [Ardenticatenia bacterium]